MEKYNLNTVRKDLKIVYSDNGSISLVFRDNNILKGVVGEFDSNLKELEKLSGSNIYFRGNSIIIKGDQKSNELVRKALDFLTHQFKTYGTIEKKDIISSMDKFMVSEKNNKNLYQLDYIIKTPKRTVIPRSKKQKDYIRALKESDIVISNGPAGTGKTYLAVAIALTMLLEKKIDRIILSRPAVEAGERLGFLPGDMRDKVDPIPQTII